ncbi:Inner membrane protein YgaP [Oligella sp. MSHR50489EDL]|uniref:rhodanese family protein n=1 Tax=Oligella sp. MSHR50489EDL TaxID=3139409 RepID=UPI003D8151AF
MTLPLITADQAATLVRDGAVLIDIRSAAEYRNRHIPNSLNHTVDELSADKMPDDGVVIFLCQSGMRTRTNANKLAAAAQNAKAHYILEGGIDSWQKQGLPVEVRANAPLELQRQVQIAVGTLVILGVVLGTWLNPAWYILSAFVGAGLLVAGLTGFCGLARLLMLAPWNRV